MKKYITQKSFAIWLDYLFPIALLLFPLLIFAEQAQNTRSDFLNSYSASDTAKEVAINNTQPVNSTPPVKPIIKPSAALSQQFKPQKSAHLDSIAYPSGIRDPFAVPSLLLQGLLEGREKKVAKNTHINFRANTVKVPAKKIPKMKIKGIIHRAGQTTPSAIILLDGESFMVKEGDEIGFDSSDPSQFLIIQKINHQSVLVAIGASKKPVTIRFSTRVGS